MIDAHCHLNDPKFANVEIEIEINKAKHFNITEFICNGYDLASSKKALNIAEKYQEVFATFGIHPEHALSTTLPDPSLVKQFVTLAGHPKIIAIGESGLDYRLAMEEIEKLAQRQLLKFHFQLASQLQLPLIIHCRDAFTDLLEILKSYPTVTVQLHCFTGTREWAEKFLDLGCYLSFGGIVTYKNGSDLLETTKRIPEDRLLIETDSPYLSPEPVRSQRNTPANLRYVAQKIATARQISIDQLDQLTTRNAYKLFPKLNFSNL